MACPAGAPRSLSAGLRLFVGSGSSAANARRRLCALLCQGHLHPHRRPGCWPPARAQHGRGALLSRLSFQGLPAFLLLLFPGFSPAAGCCPSAPAISWPHPHSAAVPSEGRGGRQSPHPPGGRHLVPAVGTGPSGPAEGLRHWLRHGGAPVWRGCLSCPALTCVMPVLLSQLPISDCSKSRHVSAPHPPHSGIQDPRYLDFLSPGRAFLVPLASKSCRRLLSDAYYPPVALCSILRFRNPVFQPMIALRTTLGSMNPSGILPLAAPSLTNRARAFGTYPHGVKQKLSTTLPACQRCVPAPSTRLPACS